MQQLKPLPRYVDVQAGNSGDISPRPRRAINHTQLDRVSAHLKHDCLSAGSLGRECHGSAPGGNNQIQISRGQVGSQGGQTSILPVSPLIVDRYIAALDKASFSEPVVKSLESTCT